MRTSSATVAVREVNQEVCHLREGLQTQAEISQTNLRRLGTKTGCPF